ncbi:hypothetical protein IE81DRAFT_320792 [Ceraceosorus guamensis]|uniref:Uncharacterized protein n=1 Tax=Ceraceosorus guamensis TaxID=1522189 RepID=A0A316W4J7_9BASI|nr:hypothetical protein IE81DRAFT_320792 [Ceraceosorus guamensis]PWN44826.1 hypothetical protein IE81DRAFT_320792 [Ceraceosorus guamensis]
MVRRSSHQPRESRSQRPTTSTPSSSVPSSPALLATQTRKQAAAAPAPAPGMSSITSTTTTGAGSRSSKKSLLHFHKTWPSLTIHISSSTAWTISYASLLHYTSVLLSIYSLSQHPTYLTALGVLLSTGTLEVRARAEKLGLRKICLGLCAVLTAALFILAWQPSSPARKDPDLELDVRKLVKIVSSASASADADAHARGMDVCLRHPSGLLLRLSSAPRVLPYTSAARSCSSTSHHAGWSAGILMMQSAQELVGVHTHRTFEGEDVDATKDQERQSESSEDAEGGPRSRSKRLSVRMCDLARDAASTEEDAMDSSGMPPPLVLQIEYSPEKGSSGAFPQPLLQLHCDTLLRLRERGLLD